MSKNSLFKISITISILLLILVNLSAIITVNAVQPTYQEKIIVDKNGRGDYITIKDAIAAAGSLSIIEIRAGTYKEHDIKINKKIALVGENPDTTIIDLENNDGFLLESTYVELNNLKIINSEHSAISISINSDYCNVSKCIIEHAQIIGIIIQGSYCSLYNVKLQGDNSSGEGITIRGSNTIINRCSIQGFKTGVLTLLSSKYNKIMYTNSFNNDVGIDFRITASYNILSQCNIYGNKYGIHIWQNSNRNQVYLNNFWKNDEDAIDEGNNTWDNGKRGNYWDHYTGVDSNNDGIGDTPYEITSAKYDRYPLIDMIPPTTITVPPNIELRSSTWDDTPSFTWDQSSYIKEIEGYFVKIGNNPEIYVGKNTNWTSSTALSNGVHTFYIRAEGTDGTTSDYGALVFSIDTNFVDTDSDGWSDEEEQQYDTDPNNNDNYPLDTDGDHTPNSIDTDDDGDGYSDAMEIAYGTSPVNADSSPTDTDNDGIPDADSPDGTYTGDIDDDEDGLTDTIEINLGSNPRDPTDIVKIFVRGISYYLVDISKNGVYDVLYNPATGHTTGIEKYGVEYYRLDINGDNSWDYIYQPSDGSIVTYSGEQPGFSTIDWLLIILSIIITIFLALFYLFKIRPQRHEKLPKPIKIKKESTYRKPLYDQPIDPRNTIELIGRTRTLFQNIQQDVQTYMEQLNQMEERLTTNTTKMETEKPDNEPSYSKPTASQEKPSQENLEKILENFTPKGNIDSKVDYLLTPKENLESKIDDLLTKSEKKQQE